MRKNGESGVVCKPDKLSIIFIFLGLVFFIWHLKLPEEIMKYLFFPWIGILLLVMGTLRTLKKADKIDFGEKKLWIPLAIIFGSIALSGVEAFLEHRMIFQEMFSAIAIGVLLFTLYLASRQLGDKIFKYMPIVVIIESISIVVVSFTNNFSPNGGLISWSNYDIATGLLFFAVLTSPIKHQWWLSAVAIVGLFFSGSAEAIFVGFCLLVMALVRRDWSWRIILPVSALVITLIVTSLTGIIWSIQAPTLSRLHLAQDTIQGKDTYQLVENNPWLSAKSGETDGTSTLDKVIGFRISHSQLTMPIKPFGYGINLAKFYWGIPHNVVLIIIEQVGILAALAWIFVMIVQLKYSPMKYTIVGILALSVFDHFVFTQAAPWWWCIIGITSVSKLKSDLIFRG